MMIIKGKNLIVKCYICQRNEDLRSGVFINGEYFCLLCLPYSLDSLDNGH